jgi:hypothetical protein
VNVFPCPRKINDEYWYISYGFVGDFMYVYKKKGPATEMEFLGLAERTPFLDTSLMLDAREFERYFINVMARRKWLKFKKYFLRIIKIFYIICEIAGRSQTPPTLEEESLCWLNANQQFRLCSQVAGALHRGKIMEINNETYYEHNCKKVKLFLREIYVARILPET